jgi:hypothetical protein
MLTETRGRAQDRPSGYDHQSHSAMLQRIGFARAFAPRVPRIFSRPSGYDHQSHSAMLQRIGFARTAEPGTATRYWWPSAPVVTM